MRPLYIVSQGILKYCSNLKTLEPSYLPFPVNVFDHYKRSYSNTGPLFVCFLGKVENDNNGNNWFLSFGSSLRFSLFLNVFPVI